MSLRPLVVAVISAALCLPAGAGTVEIPRIEAPVGSGSAGAALATGAGLTAPTLTAPAAATLSALSAPAAVTPIPALPLSAVVAPVAPIVQARTLTPDLSSPRAAVFGRRNGPPVRDGPAAESLQVGADAEAEGGEGSWARSSALFDLAGEHGEYSAVPAVPAGLPQNYLGKVLVRLRRAGESGRPGPGKIPGMDRVEWAGPLKSQGYSGETAKLLIDDKTWYMKKLGSSPDPVIDSTPRETRARNEAGMAAVLRSDPLLSRSFSVPAQVSVFRDGRDFFVLSRGLASIGDGESRRHELSSVQRADAAIIQLVLGLGDMHGADVLPLGGGRFGLIDFEKLSREPLQRQTLQQIDEQVMFKNFPLVDRLSANDPAVYRARFEAWKADYDGGGRARLDRTLAGQGWARSEREAYLAAVDRNAATYLERLQPYLDYANGWNQRIKTAKAESARREAEPRKGFFSGLFGR